MIDTAKLTAAVETLPDLVSKYSGEIADLQDHALAHGEGWPDREIAVKAGDLATLLSELESALDEKAGMAPASVRDELVEALRDTADQLERIGDTRPHKDGEIIERARAAIAKATGEDS